MASCHRSAFRGRCDLNRLRLGRAPCETASVGDRFDQEYYEKHYFDPATRVSDAKAIERLAEFILAYLRYVDLTVERVIDLGCGVGYWRSVVQQHLPKAEYVGVEVSEYLQQRFGWEAGSVVDFQAPPADLVICQGVLQYLDDAAAEAAIENLAKLTAGGLYLEALTKRDWDEAVEQATTDGNVHLRTGAWYRKRLAPHFLACGGGLFVARSAGIVLYELEGI